MKRLGLVAGASAALSLVWLARTGHRSAADAQLDPPAVSQPPGTMKPWHPRPFDDTIADDDDEVVVSVSVEEIVDDDLDPRARASSAIAQARWIRDELAAEGAPAELMDTMDRHLQTLHDAQERVRAASGTGAPPTTTHFLPEKP